MLLALMHWVVLVLRVGSAQCSNFRILSNPSVGTQSRNPAFGPTLEIIQKFQKKAGNHCVRSSSRSFRDFVSSLVRYLSSPAVWKTNIVGFYRQTGRLRELRRSHLCKSGRSHVADVVSYEPPTCCITTRTEQEICPRYGRGFAVPTGSQECSFLNRHHLG